MKSNSMRLVDEGQGTPPLRRQATEIHLDDIPRQQTFWASLALGATVAGLDYEKEVHVPLGIDAGHWSRIRSGAAGMDWPKLKAILDLYGNNIPLLWMMYQRGYDLSSCRMRETETETALREAREELEAERTKVRILTDALAGRTP